MKIAVLLVPAYQPRPYAGATPVPYQSGTVDKFERVLAGMSPLVIRHASATRLHPDPAGRFAHPEIVTAYDILHDPETTALGEAIDLALKSFNLEAITIVQNGDAEPFSKADVLSMMDGLHPWNEG